MLFMAAKIMCVIMAMLLAGCAVRSLTEKQAHDQKKAGAPGNPGTQGKDVPLVYE